MEENLTIQRSSLEKLLAQYGAGIILGGELLAKILTELYK